MYQNLLKIGKSWQKLNMQLLAKRPFKQIIFNNKYFLLTLTEYLGHLYVLLTQINILNGVLKTNNIKLIAKIPFKSMLNTKTNIVQYLYNFFLNINTNIYLFCRF